MVDLSHAARQRLSGSKANDVVRMLLVQATQGVQASRANEYPIEAFDHGKRFDLIGSAIERELHQRRRGAGVGAVSDQPDQMHAPFADGPPGESTEQCLLRLAIAKATCDGGTRGSETRWL